MTCEKRQALFSDLIKGELPATERIDLIEHIRGCAPCKDEYLRLLQFHYRLQKENVTDVPQAAHGDVNSGKAERIRTDVPAGYSRFNIWKYAAALLLTGVLLLTYFVLKDTTGPVAQKTGPDKTLAQLLENEDWNALFTIITSPSARYSHSDEKIPLRLLTEKLERLQEMGLRQINLKYLLVPAGTKTTTLRTFSLIPPQAWPVFNEDQNISVSAFIILLKKMARYKKAISLRQISEMYYLLNERTVKL